MKEKYVILRRPVGTPDVFRGIRAAPASMDPPAGVTVEIEYVDRSRVAALSRRPRADSSSLALSAAATACFFEIDLPMDVSKSNRGKIIKSHLYALKIIAVRRQLHRLWARHRWSIRGQAWLSG